MGEQIYGGTVNMEQFGSIEEKVIFEKLQASNCSQVGVNDLTVSSHTEKNLSELYRLVDVLNQTRENSAYRLILSHRKYLGHAIIFVKKVIRRCLKWYIDPICSQQTEFNNTVTSVTGNITELFIKYNQEITANAQLINELQAELNAYKQKTETRLAEEEKMLVVSNQELDCLNKEMKIRLLEKDKALTLVNQELDCLNKEMKIQLAEKDKALTLVNQELDCLNEEMNKIRQLDLGFLKSDTENMWCKTTVAQSGEDAICFYILKVLGLALNNCTYLDLGANHAKDLNNTFFLYAKGAKGVLVEANPALIPELKFYRHNDIILNKCIAEKSGDTVEFYVLNGDGLSTTELVSVERAIKVNPVLEITNRVYVETITVNEIIETYLGTAPTLLNIDIEGQEMNILKSIDFNKYRPLIIITEMIEYNTKLVVGQKNNKIVEFMNDKGYIEYAFTGINSIFIDKQQVME